MKSLLIIRHAKSSWEPGVSDHERPLNKRGFSDADMIGRCLANKNLDIDQVYSSTANRALTTARIICEELSYPLSQINFTKELYCFDSIDLINFIKKLPNQYHKVVVFGHNHGITDFVNTIGDEFFMNVPTSGAVSLKFNVNDWSKIEKANIEFNIFPKDLK